MRRIIAAALGVFGIACGLAAILEAAGPLYLADLDLLWLLGAVAEWAAVTVAIALRGERRRPAASGR